MSLTHLKNLQLTYISSERFMNEMINAVRYDRILDFRERYRSVDVLLVDDVQFLAGKEGTQTSSSTPSTRCTTPRSRSSSAATARRTRSRSWRNGCARASSGA